MNKPEWERWGLTIDPGALYFYKTEDLERGIKAHDLVADYLDRHGETLPRFKSGTLPYFNYLTLAENECLNTVGIDFVDVQRQMAEMLSNAQLCVVCGARVLGAYIHTNCKKGHATDGNLLH